MPYFKVILSGKDILYPFDGAPGGVIGFFATRVVKAPDLEQAHSAAKELVLAEWRPGGQYAADNRGSAPAVAVEESFPIGLMAGIFGRRPSGYSFYQHDD
jgi:hypothetical protein